MIDIDIIRNYFPESLRNSASFDKHLLKEYLQLMILDFISSSEYASGLCFIGGTNLRLIQKIDRFSEDLDFDCKDMTKEDFMRLTDKVVSFLRRNGLNVETRDKDMPKLTAFRRNLYFPHLLFDMNLTGHADERFLIKIEAQDQGISYKPEIADVRGCGFFFPIQVPPKGVLCSMKISAMLSRAKGRDFYDTMFLLSQTAPDYAFLKSKTGIGSPAELKQAVNELMSRTNMVSKAKDFEHLLFNSRNSARILRFAEFINSL